jgi:hypothetical protein
MTYWALEFKYIDGPELGWVPWAILGDGTLREHLRVSAGVIKVEPNVEDARVRPIDDTEATRLHRSGIQLWTKR